MTWKSKYRPRDYNDANIVVSGEVSGYDEWVGTFDRNLGAFAGPDSIIYGACGKTLTDGDISYSVYRLGSGHIEKIGTVRKSELKGLENNV